MIRIYTKPATRIPIGGLQRMVYGTTGQVALTRYNDLFQIKRIQVTGANALRLDYDYGLAGQNNGNLIKQTINGTIEQNYEHDRLGRLVKTTEGSWTEQNVFDRYGNRAVLMNAVGPYAATGMKPQVQSATDAAVEAIYPTANRWTGTAPDGSGNITDVNGDVFEYDAENMQWDLMRRRE